MLKKSASFEMVRRMVGEVIQVQAPVVELNRQGGIGWDDLQAGLMFPSFNDVVQQTGDKSAPNWEGALDDSETHARMLRIIVTRSSESSWFPRGTRLSSFTFYVIPLMICAFLRFNSVDQDLF
jgi:hypothetical protein